MARSSECTEQYAQKVFDNAGVVREAMSQQLARRAYVSRLACLRGSSHEDGLECARHVFGNFENYNLRHVIRAAIRNAEIVPVLAHLDQSDRDGGHNSQMTGHFCRIFERLDLRVWNQYFRSRVLERERFLGSGV